MKKQEAQNKINRMITNHSVRLVGDNVENCVLDTRKALRIADDMDLDLVEISSNNDISICKITDYEKFIYDKNKKEKEQKKIQKQNQCEVKELRLTPNIDEHDFNFKLNHAKNFLSEGNKVLLSVFFKGREIVYQDQGKMQLLKFVDALEGIGTAESMPKLEGKRMQMTIKPIKHQKK